MEEENIIKKARRLLNVNNEELAELIGYGYSAVNKASSGEISAPMQRAIEMLFEIQMLKAELENYNQFKKVVQKACNS